MDPDVAFAVWSRERAQRVEGALERLLAPPASARELREAMRYAVLGGGKRVRALLAYAAGELCDAEPDAVDAVAASVELIHAYSLVHDDLPCMDDDVLRRGNPTCHVAFGEATALLAGDALQSLAFEALTRGARASVAQAALLAHAAGASGMAGGQAIDLASAGKRLDLAELEQMHALKTGALIRAAVRLGAECGRALAREETAALDCYAVATGLAFQIIDDILDVEGTTQSLGKTAGKDARQGKPTYVSLAGLDAARRRVEALRGEARDALSPFGARARRLLEVADWISQRRH
ncbi:MAG TPA: farnesyl diphosphate synthase [Casimicrobiaceae bacterium]|nr:farnesyl diphosphate synthase [Casimicrobiaceae bacterium]